MKKTAGLLLTLALPLTILLIVFQLTALDINYFERSFIKNQVSAVTQLNDVQLKEISVEIIKYLKNERQDLIIFEEINNRQVQIFENREIEHMKDVKKLFIQGYLIRNILLLILVSSGIFLFYKDKIILLTAIRSSSIISVILISILIFMAYIDFQGMFIIFHKILFDNDLWMLDINEDILIQMLPLNFFIGIAEKTAFFFAGWLAINFFSVNILLAKIKRIK